MTAEAKSYQFYNSNRKQIFAGYSNTEGQGFDIGLYRQTRLKLTAIENVDNKILKGLT